ncbi:MAG: ABC transporter ATP-binding protein [Candidatus Aminicenantes bacterium]|nr:ABC transporter ATP-binding protein [Candidatus Aminicenantes bacterium]
MNDLAIRTHSLSKRYGDVRAVETLDLNVRRGEIYAFLGRNGAGKTTTIRMLLGLVRPTRGEVEVLGRRIIPGESSVFRRVGYLVETATAYPNLTVEENLDIQRRLTSAPKSAVSDSIDRLRLGPYARKRAGRLSLGNLQRLALARALLHAPELLILDEPANGLDPAGIVEIRDLLQTLSTRGGATVFLSSHILAEVAHLADRIGIIHEGRLCEELDRAELLAKENPSVELVSSDNDRATALLEAAGFARIEAKDGLLRIFDAPGREAEVARTIVGAGLDLFSLATVKEDLESYFLRRTGGLAS